MACLFPGPNHPACQQDPDSQMCQWAKMGMMGGLGGDGMGMEGMGMEDGGMGMAFMGVCLCLSLVYTGLLKVNW